MFRNLTNTLTHPAALPVIGILLLVILVFLTLSVVSPETKPRKRQFSDNPMMNALGWAGVILALPGLAILIAAGWELIVLAWNYPPLNTKASEIRWHSSIMLAMLAAIGAIFTLVFAYIRSFATERQTRATEESLFNDKINAAADDLHARRQVTKSPDEKDNHWDYWQDDIVRRNAAIDRLEGLAIERPDIAPRIARMLSIYVRELSAENLPQVVPKRETPRVVPKEPSPQNLTNWMGRLSAIRSDMENAAQTLGRLPKIDGVESAKVDVDLRRANLQGFALHGLTFDQAQMQGAEMQSAYLHKAKMKGADLLEAKMQRADLRKAQMQGASLSWTQMQEADLSGTQMQGAVLIRAQMQKASLGGAQMQGAVLSGAQMQRAVLSGAQMQRASLSGAQMQNANLMGAQMQGAILSKAQMQGASLNGAKLQGAVLSEAQMDSATSLREAIFSGAALREVDYSDVSISQAQVDELFYDGSVTFAEGITRAPGRDEVLGWGDFRKQWRAWQREKRYEVE